ncbi:hypothetical protein Tco_0632480 [Tanacetum coccineum]
MRTLLHRNVLVTVVYFLTSGSVGCVTYTDVLGSDYVLSLTIEVFNVEDWVMVKIDFSKVIWDDLLSKLQKKHKEKVVPYSRFISLLMEHKIKDTYENPEATNIHTLIFIVNNWTLKKDQPEGPPFTAHVLDIYTAYGPEEFKSPTLPTKELKPKGKKPGAKCEHMKSIPVTKNYPGSNKEATFIGPLTKKATKALKGQSKKKKKSVMAKYKNPSVDPNP